MKRIIIADSCLELNEELKNKLDIKLVGLNLDLGDKVYKDDENLNVEEFVKEMNAYTGVAKSAAPSPQEFYDQMEGYDEVFIISISSRLSTVYNSALIAKSMKNESDPEVKVHIFDSKSAVSGETLLAIKIQELMDKGLSFEDIVEEIEDFKKDMRTYFILENLDNLVKNGRMSKLAGKIASTLSINPVCKGNDGVIEVATKSRGMKAGLMKLVDLSMEGIEDFPEKTLVIGHVLNEERAIFLRDKYLSKYKFKEVYIVPSKGLTSIYANEGGIVVAI